MSQPASPSFDRAKAAVEELFTATFLVDPCNRHWRDLIVDASGKPLAQDPRVLLTFAHVADALPQPHNAATLQQLCQALSSSAATSLVRVVPAAVTGSLPKIIRAEGLDLLKCDPNMRTVFAKPVHLSATDDQIKSFFGVFGDIERVERRVFLDLTSGAKTEVAKGRPSVFVTFSTVEAARRCVREKPTYAASPDPLASLFIPRLVVTMKDSFEQQEADAADREFARVQREALEKAAGADHPPAAAAPEEEAVKKFLLPGHTCVIRNLPAGLQWSDIKTTLGNLCLNDKALRSKIGLVQVEGSTAYVILRTIPAVQSLLAAYRTAVAAKYDATFSSTAADGQLGSVKFADKMLRTVPSLELCSGAEEQRVIERYPQWVAPRVARKQQLNEPAVGDKRPRE